ncbi:MAG: ATP-binding protein, partial [Deltaproteobacteria bacterium]|nr:ATP-binding protein [Deltaproteobacteria bacterium]
MDSVYMNNFRGFTRTVVPIRPVNFLVGENSTGKTSFLALTELFSLSEFWFRLDFNAGNYKFGDYKDIVSALSHNQDEFQIGICKGNEKATGDSTYHLLHFRKSKDGVPELARFSQLCKKYLATIRIYDRHIAAAVSIDFPSPVDRSSMDACFALLQETAKSSPLDYKELSDDEARFMRRSPIYFFPRILAGLLDEKGMKSGSSTLLFPGLPVSFASMAPIRTTPKRTYDGYIKLFSPEGEHTPYVIRKKLPRGKNTTNAFRRALEDFGKDSGLFQSVGINRFGKDGSTLLTVIILPMDPEQVKELKTLPVSRSLVVAQPHRRRRTESARPL